MIHTDETTTTTVISADGTEIACTTSGDGPPLLLVHGTTADHTRWRTILPYLEPHATVHAVDRRGRGASGDASDYALAREFEDVAAVVDAIAKASGSAVDVLGHSYGGDVAFGAATLTPNIRKLVLYEGWPSPHPRGSGIAPETWARMDALLADGQPEAMLEVFFREVVGIREDDFVRYRALPSWQARIAAAHTVLRETRACRGNMLDVEAAARVTMPVLMLVGGASPPEMQSGYQDVADALPDARVVVLEGQQHIAIDLIPEELAATVLAFLGRG